MSEKPKTLWANRYEASQHGPDVDTRPVSFDHRIVIWSEHPQEIVRVLK